MRMSAVISVLVLVGALVPWAASAQDCDNHSFRVDIGSFANLDEPIPPYDACWEFTKTVGTLNGRYVSCVLLAEICDPFPNCHGRTSDDIWGDGYGQLQAWKYYSFLETKQGVLDIQERSWRDEDFGNETGIGKIVGGTGAFEGAIGTLSYTPGFPNRSDLLVFQGFICIP